MALANYVLPVGRELRLQHAFAERLICEVALIGAFYTHIANLFLRSAIKRSSMLACLRPLHPALSQITGLCPSHDPPQIGPAMASSENW